MGEPPHKPSAANGDGRNLPVLASEARPLEPAEPQAPERPAEAPLAAPVLAATGGFLAGVATFVLVRVLRGGRGRRALLRRNRKRDKALEIAGSRSFLVDVHVLKR